MFSTANKSGGGCLYLGRWWGAVSASAYATGCKTFDLSMLAALVLNLVANGMTAKQIVKEYPYLEEEDIHQALQYAAWLADESIQILEPVTA